MSFMAEQNVIGALFLDQRCIEKICGFLKTDMFTSEIHGRIYLEFLRAYDNRYELDIPNLAQKLQSELDAGLLMQVIRECTALTVTSTTITSSAKVIYNDYKAYRLAEIINRSKPSSDKIETQIGDIIRELENLQEDKQSKMQTLSSVAKENADKYFRDNQEEKIFLGFERLDDILGGLEGGDVIVIGARPGVGKSAFVTQITSNLEKQNKKVAFYNLEMREKQIYERFIVNKSGIGLTRLKRAKDFLGDEKVRFEKANEKLFKCSNVYIVSGSKHIEEIRRETRHMDLDLIIIDYLQLLKIEGRYPNRTSEVGALSRAVKALAMELNIPIIILSQLNRASEMKETKEPTMAELRETGDIEQDASVIILLWNLTEDRVKKGVKVDKNRQGIFGKSIMNFDGNIMQFVETDETVEQINEWVKRKEYDDCPF